MNDCIHLADSLSKMSTRNISGALILFDFLLGIANSRVACM